MHRRKISTKLNPSMIIRGILSSLLFKNMTLRQQKTFRMH